MVRRTSFAFELDHLLRKRGLRHRVPIDFVTPEPYLGHFGIGGLGKGRQFLEGELEERDIRYQTSAAVSSVGPETVDLGEGRTLPSKFSMIMPQLAGITAIAESPDLGNPKAFVPADHHYRHPEFPNIFTVGVAVAMPPRGRTRQYRSTSRRPDT